MTERPISGAPGRGFLPELSRGTALEAVVAFAACCILLALNAHAPSADLVTLSGVGASVSLFSASVSALAWLGVQWRANRYRRPIVIIGAIALATLALHLSIVNASGAGGCVVVSGKPSGCIGDELYYVPAAQMLLAGTQCAPAVNGCNMEHPFLGHAVVAAGMSAFGTSALGERIGSIIMGVVGIPVVFALALVLSGETKLAYAASLLLALDPLYFSQSSAAFLDVPSLVIALVAFLAYFARVRIWKLDELAVAGIILGVAALAKETAVLLLVVLVVYHTLFKEGAFSVWAKDVIRLVGSAGVVLALGMQAYDSVLAAGAFPWFYQQVGYIISYGSSLSTGAWTDVVLGTPITPLNWISYYAPVGYLTLPSAISVPGPAGVPLFPSVGYYAALDPVLAWTLYLWGAVAVILAVKAVREGVSPVGLRGDEGFLFFQGVWFAVAFLSFVGLWLFGRVTYPYYIIVATPAMAGGTGYLITRPWFSRWAALLVVGVAALGFLYFFPVKGFMPEWLRTLFPR